MNVHIAFYREWLSRVNAGISQEAVLIRKFPVIITY